MIRKITENFFCTAGSLSNPRIKMGRKNEIFVELSGNFFVNGTFQTADEMRLIFLNGEIVMVRISHVTFKTKGIE